MFHTAAYFTASLSTTANFDVPALGDDVLTISNSHFLPQQDLDLVAAAAMSANLNRARLVSPSNRQVTLPFIRPINAAAIPATQQEIPDYIENPFRIRGLEELALEASSDIAMGNEDCNALVWLTPGLRIAPRGNIFTMRGTSTTAAVADTWTSLTMTWADILPQGEFAVLGLEVIGAGGIAGRLILEGQTWRPGCLAMATVGLQAPVIFRKGLLGDWGRFRSTSMPIPQVLCNTTTAVWTVYMDIVRTQ